MHLRRQGVSIGGADPTARPVRLLFLLPRRHHLPAADLPTADPAVLRDAHQWLLLPAIRMPCPHDSQERECCNNYDDNDDNNASSEVWAADARGINGSQRLRRERQLLPGGPGGEEGERALPGMHLRRQWHDKVQPQGVPAAGTALAQDEPVLLQDAVGGATSALASPSRRQGERCLPSSTLFVYYYYY